MGFCARSQASATCTGSAPAAPGLGNIKAATYGALMGTHLRVGQEENLFERPGVPFKSNAAQVEKIVRIMREFALEPATAAEARSPVGLPA